MENRINVAELLKDCPKGMELDCIMFEGIEFDSIVDNEHLSICCRIKNTDGGYNVYNFTKHGCWIDAPFTRCVIFPKGKKTWEGFVPPCKFKDGDIVATMDGKWIGITTGGESGQFIPTYCAVRINGDSGVYFCDKEKWKFSRFATVEEKQKLFKVIKDNGYKWNAETKTLEKLVVPKFKVGDRIRSVISLSCYTIIGIEDGQYVIQPDEPEKFPYHIPFSLEINYELVSKFDINSLIPFESKVLVRDSEAEKWRPAIWGYYDSDSTYNYPYEVVGGHGFSMCIPHEGNEHLLGTTKDCEDRYKLWLS